jgi:hypothetical protein
MYVFLYIDAPSHNHFFREKATSVTYFEHVLVIQYAKRMRRVIFSSGPVWLYQMFPHYIINDMIFGKNVNLHKICFDFLLKFRLEHFSSGEFSDILP